MSTTYIAIGTNLGNREKNIEHAYAYLKAHNISVTDKASVIETDPVGGPTQGKFLNTVIKAETDLHPLELLRALQSIEKRMGRVKRIVNGPRVIDLDILLYDDVTITSPNLEIPHPRMFERAFVLKPLSEIAPEIANM